MIHKLAIILLLLYAPLAVIGGGQSESGPTKVGGDPVTLPDGLKYWDIAVGKGAAAVGGKRVRVHYTGWLLDGTKFDSSLDRGPDRLHHHGPMRRAESRMDGAEPGE